MQLDVQWFIAALVSEELMTREDCLKVLETVGLDAEISEVAQEALNLASQSVSEDEAEDLLEPFETAAEYAMEQAESGEQLPEDYSLSLFGELLQPEAEPEPEPEPEPFIPEPPKPPTPNLSKILADPGRRSESSGEHKPLPSLPKPKLDGLKASALKAELGAALPGLGMKPAIPMSKPTMPVNPPPVQAPPANAGDELGIKEEEKAKSLPASQIRPTDYAIQIAINDAYPREVSDNWAGLTPFEAVTSLEGEELRDFMLSLLREVRQRGASDLHISSLAYPFARRNGQIETISDHIITPDEAFKMNTILLNKAQYGFYEENKDINYALQVDASNRFRVCLITHKDGAAGSYRLVSEELKSLTELGFSEKNTKTIENFLDFHNGLILVTGPIGSGKTTTLASMVNIINEKRHDHVITVEDPIEIVQYSKGCNVTQRELRAHTSTYKAALKGALREDPDVIIIGELHDLETIEMAITASETGHLVIGTLHTCDAANTLNRLLDVFPPSQQPQIRAMTSGSLRGIVCQKLLPAISGGMTVAAEILVNTTAVQNIVSDGRTHHLKATIQTGQNAGMTTMDNSVLDLYQRGIITRETAERNIRASDVKQDFKRIVAIEEAKKLSGN